MKFFRTAITALALAAAGSLAYAPATNAQTIEVPGSAPVTLPDIPRTIEDAITGVLNQLPDGAPAPLPAPEPAPNPAPTPAPLPTSTGCAAIARACINLSQQTAWLQDGGFITRGPVPISSGRAGYATPTGLTQVTRKIIDEWSRPYNGPMPYSVYFSAGSAYPSDIGIAFHEGDPAVASHGCIHLVHDDAVAFFNTLAIGDHVDVVA